MEQEQKSLDISWLVRLRWGALASQGVVVAFAAWVIDIPLPLASLAAVMGALGVSNLALVAASQRLRLPEWVAFAVLAFDVVVLTAVLQLTGGPFNPFSVLYLVYLSLAAVTLRQRWTWALMALAGAAFGLLFFLENPDTVHHAQQMKIHLQGMWLAFVIAAAFIVYFVHRVVRALAQRDAELAQARLRAVEHEKLAALATLAAGAAHELATPLSTIAVVSRELERSLQRTGSSSDAADDARLIREQTERCRMILTQLSEDAGQAVGEQARAVAVSEFLDAVARDFGGAGLDVRVDPASAMRVVRLPVRAMVRALHGVVDNALKASPPGVPITLRATCEGRALRISVADQGPGMSPEVRARATEPFFTTREQGRGMGLGLFVTRQVVEQLGGELMIDSAPGAGTMVTVRLPVSSSENADAA